MYCVERIAAAAFFGESSRTETLGANFLRIVVLVSSDLLAARVLQSLLRFALIISQTLDAN